MSTTAREHLGWMIRESGREDSDRTVFLIPGALASAIFCDDLVAEPMLVNASIRFVATTVPGFGHTSAPADVSVEEYARQVGALARDLRCDAVVGHSFGANVALEMAAAGEFSGPALPTLLSFFRLTTTGSTHTPPLPPLLGGSRAIDADPGGQAKSAAMVAAERERQRLVKNARQRTMYGPTHRRRRAQFARRIERGEFPICPRCNLGSARTICGTWATMTTTPASNGPSIASATAAPRTS